MIRDEKTGRFVAESEKEKLEREIAEKQALLNKINAEERAKILEEKKKAEEAKNAERKADADKVNAIYKKYVESVKVSDNFYKDYLNARNEFVKKYGYFHQSFTSDDGLFSSFADIFNIFCK